MDFPRAYPSNLPRQDILMEHQFFKVIVASADHYDFAQMICDEMEASAKARGTGIAKRSAEYLQQKMSEGKAVKIGRAHV